MDEALLDASIYPSIANGYCKLKNSIAYTENLAKLIQEKKVYVEAGLGKHLLGGFIERKVTCNKDEKFGDIINKLSQLINERFEQNKQSENCYAERVELISCLREIDYKNPQLKILTDENRLKKTNHQLEGGTHYIAKPFMERNGYYDGGGWWIKEIDV
jgi:hypothetical protein